LESTIGTGLLQADFEDGTSHIARSMLPSQES